jgi:O-antigen chain-terminating methyltransferase
MRSQVDPAGSDAELQRLKDERDEADRRYNDALTNLDAAVQRPAVLPDLPPASDEHQIPTLNQLWNIVPEPPPGTGPGWRTRFAGLVWRVAGPILQRQQEFNSAIVDHINRNVAAQRHAQYALEHTLSALRDQLAGVVQFESRLIEYLQQITPFVDTKDREVAGRMIGLTAAIDGVGDEVLKRWESMVAREQRYDAKVSAITIDQRELQGSVAVLQQASQGLRREIERALAVAPAGAGRAAPLVPAAIPSSSALQSHSYVGFEDQFRGSQDEIRGRVADYVAEFTNAANVLDVGCGRGEFLDLLRERGIGARGLDVNPEMVARCREQGLEVEQADALEYLQSIGDGSLGGMFAAQVVEHLAPDYLVHLLEAAYHKLRAGAPIVLETINPACWFAFFESYIRDITHVRPIHADTLQYLLVASGFQRVRIRYRAPFPDADKLQRLPEVPSDDRLADVVQTFNENVDRINGLLFTHLDYAAIATRL